eukprot:CAMPEP_0198252858 /NCGR_PEP_ID=MMETSP1447-20131203/3305_1 /TAXON_ID=420782 /ORGANISM="Chaetoceros dichaeta, Strain CCMP1751" /LENGTH=652 /DNA_ID=CAMNT_0043938253 /DNA_START=30 /DNA_END=1988 /DNA_ORIENTATION=+
MADNEVKTTVAADTAPQDVQDEAANAVAQKIGENGSGTSTETKAGVEEIAIAHAPSEIPENDLKTADEGASVDKTKDTDVSAEVVTEKNTEVKSNDNEGDGNTDTIVESGTEKGAEEIISDESPKIEEVQEVRDDAQKDSTTDIEENAIPEVEDEKKGEDGETEVHTKPGGEANGAAGKEVEEDVVETINETSADEIKADTKEEVKLDVTVGEEDAVKDHKDISMEVEEVKDGAVEDKEVIEEVIEKVAEDVEEEVAEEVIKKDKEEVTEEDKDVATDETETIVNEVKEDVTEEDKDVAMDEKETVVNDFKATKKGKTVTTPLKEGTALEGAEDTEMEDEKAVIETPKATRGRKSKKKLQESPYSLRGETRRERKVANHFEPGNFIEDRKKSSIFSVKLGKGTKLTDIPSVKNKLDKTAAKDPTMIAAHKFLFGGRGPTNKKFLKKQLMGFSGFIPADNKGEEEENGQTKEEDDDAILEKFASRANKMFIPLLKSICDLFDIDRTPPPKGKVALDKDSIVDRLLNFLAAPDVKLTNAGTRTTKKRGRTSMSKSPKSKKAKKAEEVEVEVEYDEEMEEEEEEEEEEEIVKGPRVNKMPTKKELRKFVRAYVTCFSMEKTTTKHLIQTASDKFDINVASKKKDILELLTAEMPE